MSTRLGFTTILVLVAIACGQDHRGVPVTPAAPTPTPPSGGPTPMIGSNTITGVVVETSSQGPLAGVSVNAWVQESRLGYSYMWAHGPVTTDAAGVFRLSSLATGTTVRLQVWKDGYVQQCAAPLVTVTSDLRQDVQLVSRANVPVSPQAIAPPAPGFRSVSGMIVEITAAGQQPVAGVFVDFEPLEDFPAAVTYSDTSGRYLLCGLPDNQTVTLGAGLGSRVAYLNVAPGRTTGVDIVLP
jgi:hypothetical protein